MMIKNKSYPEFSVAPMKAGNQTLFVPQKTNTYITFQKDATGQVTGLRINQGSIENIAKKQ